MKVLLANRMKKKVYPKISRAKKANNFKRKRHAKIRVSLKMNLSKKNAVFGGLGMSKVLYMKQERKERDIYHLNYDGEMHLRNYNNIRSRNDVLNVLDHIFNTLKSAYKIQSS
jgi:hypothetical protein